MKERDFAALVAERLTEMGYTVEVVDAIRVNVTAVGIAFYGFGSPAPILFPKEFADRIGFGMSERGAEECASAMDAFVSRYSASVAGLANDREKAEQHIVAVACNTQNNRELLAALPHREICSDLSVYYIIKTALDDQLANAKITSMLAEEHGWTESFLYTTAIRNMLPHVTVKPIAAQIEELTGEPDFEGACGSLPELSVITMDDFQFGSGAVLCFTGTDAILPGFCQGIRLIPSSIHEWIAVRKGIMADDDLAELIRDVNACAVRPEEVLSDHAYSLEDFYKFS